MIFARDKISRILGVARAGANMARADGGASAAEFALIFPIMLLILFAVIKFGITINNDIELTSGANAGVREFAVSRGSTTPLTDATNMFKQAAPNLGHTTLTFKVGNNSCTSDTACQTALNTAQGQPVQLIASYPCDLSIMGFDFAPNCKLSSDVTQLAE